MIFNTPHASKYSGVKYASGKIFSSNLYGHTNLLETFSNAMVCKTKRISVEHFRFVRYEYRLRCHTLALLIVFPALPVIFSNEEQKQSVLQWLGEAGGVRVDRLEVVWRHGWIVCGALDAALPGACAGHPPTRLSLKHAQSIADNYLGVEPVRSHSCQLQLAHSLHS